MRIKKIVINNIGPYVDKNEFNINLDDKKNIVLIGGKNGAGKTTFFHAIKTCLYGSRVMGYEVPCTDYYNSIKKLINSKLQYDNNFCAYIELELEFNNGKEKNIYLLHREWNKNKKSLSEKYIIYKNDLELSNEKYNDFTNYLLSIIPPDMFNFYFFDGESIADFFLGNDGDKNFKNAFLKLYGLDTLSLMVDNFARCSKKRNKNMNAHDKFISCKNCKENISQQIETVKNKIFNIENEIDQLNVRNIYLSKAYEIEGGVSLEEWKNLNINIAKEETKRDEINKWLKEIANNYLPFIIIKENINKLKDAIVDEIENKKTANVFDYISSKSLEEKIHQLIDDKNLDKNSVDTIINHIKETTSNRTEFMFDLSDMEAAKIINQIDLKNNFDVNEIHNAQNELKKSLAKSKRLRNKLGKSSIEGYEKLISVQQEIQLSIANNQMKLNKYKDDLMLLEEKQISIIKDYEKAKNLFEQTIKSKSVNELSLKAVATYTLLEEKLIQKQSIKLQSEFIKCFKSIINKDNFIDGIVIDNKINVTPYKFIDVNCEQINNYLEENKNSSFLELIDEKYKIAIKKLIDRDIKDASLPSPIKAPFSQGERQVYIMSLYLALLKTSEKDIPFFIDTPFARIDSNHREKIINKFFKSLPNQMFILSTDEEIVGKHRDLLKGKISNEFILKIDKYGITKVKGDSYFNREEEK